MCAPRLLGTLPPVENGKVWLVGAGPGDPGLITVRGLEVLRRAEVVLYDTLAHPALLEEASQAEHRDVGKRYGEPAAKPVGDQSRAHSSSRARESASCG